MTRIRTNYENRHTIQARQRVFKMHQGRKSFKKDWVLDHKIPVSLFNIKGIKSKDFKQCWALENLQPMWEKENIKKSNNLLFI